MHRRLMLTIYARATHSIYTRFFRHISTYVYAVTCIKSTFSLLLHVVGWNGGVCGPVVPRACKFLVVKYF
jgi:hypothetical protein